MHQDKARQMAREAVVDCTDRHDYMPATPLLAEDWQPHRWVVDAMLLAAHEAEQERDRYRAGNTYLLDLLMQWVDGAPGVEDDTLKTLRNAGLLHGNDVPNWAAIKAREMKQQTWEEAALDDNATAEEVHAAARGT